MAASAWPSTISCWKWLAKQKLWKRSCSLECTASKSDWSRFGHCQRTRHRTSSCSRPVASSSKIGMTGCIPSAWSSRRSSSLWVGRPSACTMLPSRPSLTSCLRTSFLPSSGPSWFFSTPMCCGTHTRSLGRCSFSQPCAQIFLRIHGKPCLWMSSQWHCTSGSDKSSGTLEATGLQPRKRTKLRQDWAATARPRNPSRSCAASLRQRSRRPWMQRLCFSAPWCTEPRLMLGSPQPTWGCYWRTWEGQPSNLSSAKGLRSASGTWLIMACWRRVKPKWSRTIWKTWSWQQELPSAQVKRPAPARPGGSCASGLLRRSRMIRKPRQSKSDCAWAWMISRPELQLASELRRGCFLWMGHSSRSPCLAALRPPELFVLPQDRIT